MVRRASPVLSARAAALLLAALLVAAQAYVLLAGDLPDVGSASDTAMAGGWGGVLAVVVGVAAVAPLGDEPPLLVLAGLGTLLLVGMLAVADAGSGATVVEAMGWGAVGALFAIATQTPALVVALPVFVAAVDLGSGLVGGGGPSGLLLTGDPQTGDVLSLTLPGWDGAPAPARLGITDAAFLGVFLTYARRFDLRPVFVAAASATWLAAVFTLELREDVVVPTVPVLAGVFLGCNLDRLPRVVRAARTA
ncbi:hypothetical protein [Conexibacter sp. SYSU D00693]|uniref:hypothetical protein n=1 Tax=Conexibacter sp. SYSU D00693 TaxID=2812560 RepID=UPI00196ABAE9|nr:hypothetical protein [Conexibacter sp. SYSU D00693]